MVKKQTWTEMDKSNIPFANLRRSYALYNQTTNKSPRTIHWYEERLELFNRFFGPDAVWRTSPSRTRAPSSPRCSHAR